MNEVKKTVLFGLVAIVLVVSAFVLSPRRITPEAFADQGQPFFPEFTDPNEATTLEVVDFDESTGEAHPFKVTFKNGKWTIPSHYDYPADGKDRLAKTAAGVIDIKKDEFRTDNVSDHDGLGVLDPMDQTGSLSGRGERVTIKGENDKVLADIIIGKPVAGKQGFRYVRLPDQNRVYAVKMDIDISTNFDDWIDRDLLHLTKDKIQMVDLKDYSIDERTFTVQNRDNLVLTKADSKWTANKLTGAQKLDSTRVDSLLAAIAAVQIVGVRPKPEGLSASLKQTAYQKLITQNYVMSLQSKGFYFTRQGQLMSNEGELQVGSSDGILYTLRFGEVVYGSGVAITAGTPDSSSADKGKASENRYLFITADFDPSYLKEPPKPGNMDFQTKADSAMTVQDRKNKELFAKHQQWRQRVDTGTKLAKDLSDRFADWYYVISADSYNKIHQERTQLLAKK